jgi:hypothetical protein
MITNEEFEYMLRNSGAKLLNETGSCEIMYASGDNLFVMRGPTGTHRLFADATDLNRLNAHWLGFSNR